MMITVLLNERLRPLASVMCPSSSTCNKMLRTSAWAFSISSNRMIWYGRRARDAVRAPASSCPT